MNLKKSKHIISINDCTPSLIDSLFEKTRERLQHHRKYRVWRTEQQIRGLLFALFYEPSSRTRFSFEIAARELGMNVLSTEDAAKFSSAAKGERLEDSIRVFCDFGATCIALRHNENDAAERAARVIDEYGYNTLVINSGSGTLEHPTQALIDLFTIEKHLGRKDNIRIAFCGDLRYGRTVKSLTKLLSHYKTANIFFVAPEEFQITDDIKVMLIDKKIPFSKMYDIRDALPYIDVLYMTRIQKERFTHEIPNMEKFRLTVESIKDLLPHAIILHPMPRNDEIDYDIDKDIRAIYFDQSSYGIPIRMSLMEMLLKPVEEDSMAANN